MDKAHALRRTLARGTVIFVIACVVVWGCNIGIYSINPADGPWLWIAVVVQSLVYIVSTIAGILIAGWIAVSIWMRVSERDPR